jgi:hyperosmotically inducible periplasmic protein
MRALRALVIGAVLVPAIVAASLPDEEIRAQIERKLEDANLSSVTVAVERRVVTLSGTVPHAWGAGRAFKLAQSVSDVEAVVSRVSVPAPESEKGLAQEVAKALGQAVSYGIFDDVNVRVEGGVVTLIGQVTGPHKSKEIENLAARVPGVQRVANRIEVLPASQNDDRLRGEVANEIYSDPLFWRYAIQSQPPVHIVVKGGHVTLTGVVATELEKRKAELIARGCSGTLSTENRLVVEK